MQDALDVVPTQSKLDSGIESPREIADGLADALADTYRLVYKTHAYHWNVEGPLFYSLHELTEGQYKSLFDAADDIAERMRALGALAPFQLSKILQTSIVEDVDGTPDARTMVEDLASSHEKTAKRMREVAEMASDKRDIVTEDLLTDRIAEHEEAVWMLRAIAKQDAA